MKNRAKYVLTALLALCASVGFAARQSGRGAKRQESKPKHVKTAPPAPVAEGFPVWRGFDTVLYDKSRDLSPSDLRGRFTIVATIEAGSSVPQFQRIMDLQKLCLNAGSRTDWDFGARRSDTIMVVNIKAGDSSRVKRLKDNEKIGKAFVNLNFSIYGEVTFDGAPDSGGNYPFVYVIPPEGKEPIFKGKADANIFKNVSGAIKKARKDLKEWRSYYGYAGEIKFNKSVVSAIESGKSLVQAQMALQKGILSKNPEMARESQILYDAIEQRKGDLVFAIKHEYKPSPMAAICDFDEFSKRWPTLKKEVAEYAAKASAEQDMQAMMRVYPIFRKYAAVDFKSVPAPEAAKIAAEIMKTKPAVEKLTASKNMKVQSVAFSLQRKIETIAGEMAAKAEAK